MVDSVMETTSKKSCNYSEYGSFECLLFTSLSCFHFVRHHNHVHVFIFKNVWVYISLCATQLFVRAICAG